jgi:hypothetical protein
MGLRWRLVVLFETRSTQARSLLELIRFSLVFCVRPSNYLKIRLPRRGI